MKNRPHRRVTKRFRKKSAPGAPPGTLVTTPAESAPHLEVIRYSPQTIERRQLADVRELAPYLQGTDPVWFNVDGPASAEVMHTLGELLSIHPLVLEDVVNLYQRPKVEHYGENLFVVARAPLPNMEQGSEQVSFYLSKNVLVTFQEHAGGDVFDPVRKQLEKGQVSIRRCGVDYLLYALLDSVIDFYFPVIERLSDRIESLEIDLIEKPTQSVVQSLHVLRQELLVIKRAAWPFREAINSLIRDQAPVIQPETRVHLRDCYDHTFQIIELVETYREICSDLMNLHLSSVSNRMSEVMKVLTIISTVFIPLNFVVGLYGMNFNTEASPWNMPELNSIYGYPVVVGVMIVIAVSLLANFRWRGWW